MTMMPTLEEAAMILMAKEVTITRLRGQLAEVSGDRDRLMVRIGELENERGDVPGGGLPGELRPAAATDAAATSDAGEQPREGIHLVYSAPDPADGEDDPADNGG